MFGPVGQAHEKRRVAEDFPGRYTEDQEREGTPVSDSQSDDFRLSALAYHHGPRPGKIEVVATKPLGTQHDLALAYTPGVAVACEAIAAEPQEAARLTARGNLVAVVTNGTAVLGLGNIGPLAGKPV